MDWKEKIKLGMSLIKEGCKENPIWSGNNCCNCPFTEICDSCVTEIGFTPEDWFISEEE